MPWLIHRDTCEQHWFTESHLGIDRSVCDAMAFDERVDAETLKKWRALPPAQHDQLRRTVGMVVWAPDTCERCWRLVNGDLRMPFTDELRNTARKDSGS